MKPYHFKTLRARLTTLLISPVVVVGNIGSEK